eukprot:12418121-Karenia_brevis.AAC.1
MSHFLKPLLQTKLLAALLSVLNFKKFDNSSKANSLARLNKPLALVTPSTMAYNSASALLRA